ncbi:MAG: YgjV family protein [Treponema sp.]|nr:YgjV family protein [Treponema sp.]
MNTHTIIEIVGYTGSAIVLLSFLMTSVVKLRLVNSLGGFIFMIYALIIHSYPTALMNLCLVLINMRFLWKMRTTEKEYDIVKVDKDDSFLHYMIESYRDDILRWFPGLSLNFNNMNRAYIVCCKNVPAGIVVGDARDGVMELLLDYSTPEYRDFSIGAFLMRSLSSDGVKKLIYRGPATYHKNYLAKTGFVKTGDAYEKTLE